MKIVNLFNSDGFKEFSFGAQCNGAEKEIASIFGAKNIGFHVEVMNPKSFSCPYHYHDQEEELVIVLEGEAVLRQNNVFRKVRAGDLIYYKTGSATAHHLYNHTEYPFKYFILSTKFPEEFCHYPDSNKKLDKKNQEVTQNGNKVDYWKDEENPTVHWPEHALKGEVPW